MIDKFLVIDKFFDWCEALGKEYPKFIPLINDHFGVVVGKQHSVEDLKKAIEIVKNYILNYLEKIENLNVDKFKQNV